MRRKDSCRNGNQDNGRGDTVAPAILWLQMAQLHAMEVQLEGKGKEEEVGRMGVQPSGLLPPLSPEVPVQFVEVHLFLLLDKYFTCKQYG